METKHIDRKTKSVRDAALAALRQEVGSVKKPPHGWLTCKQIAQATDLSPRHAINIVNEWMGTGLVKVQKFKVVTGQMHRLTPHYAFHPRLATAYNLPVSPGIWKR